jgi:hypothetical protein
MSEIEIAHKQRNYSFLTKNEDALDAVENDVDAFIIPAQPGSCYWAIIKVGYLNHDKPILLEEYINQVADLLAERNPKKWDEFKNKKTVKTKKNGEIVERIANDWRKRVETNIKTLTRDGGDNPYGKRLIERGHILRWEPHYFTDKGAFVLRTDTNVPIEIKRGRTKKQEKP